MNGEDVVVGGRYVVGPEPTYRDAGAVMRCSLDGGEIVTAWEGPYADGDFAVQNDRHQIYSVDPRHLTPYVEPDAAEDAETAHLLESPANAAWLRESAWRNEAHAVLKEARDEIAALRERAEKAEAELERIRVAAVTAEANEDHEVVNTEFLVNELIAELAHLRERAEKAEKKLDTLSAAFKAECQVRREVVAQLRTSPQIPADLPDVGPVTRLGDLLTCGPEQGWATYPTEPERLRMFAARYIAVAAFLDAEVATAEAAKPNPVEELARVILGDDEDNWESWEHIDERARFRYRRMSRAAIAWTEEQR